MTTEGVYTVCTSIQTKSLNVCEATLLHYCDIQLMRPMKDESIEGKLYSKSDTNLTWIPRWRLHPMA